MSKAIIRQNRNSSCVVFTADNIDVCRRQLKKIRNHLSYFNDVEDFDIPNHDWELSSELSQYALTIYINYNNNGRIYKHIYETYTIR